MRHTLEGRLGSMVRSSGRVSGGDVATSYRVELADGRTVFAKTRAEAPSGFFVTEASGLQWLRSAQAVAVPEVLAVAEAPPMLALEWIEPGRVSASTGTGLGQSLAALHQTGSACFGREDRRPTGSRQLPNDPAPSWAEFYRERRLRPLAQIAEATGALSADTVTSLRRLADRVEGLLGPAEPPARLHGDLWAGNRLVDVDGRSWLIDPAAFGGHREFDLAMMRLFGGFGAEVFSAYDEAHPLADGWEERVALHQVAPLVVHAVKFGGGYVRAVTEAIGRYC